MVWEEERNGCYSVKSGYKLAMKCIFRNDKYHVEDEVEDDVHAFFTCVSAQSSWQAAGLSSVLGSAACQQGSAAKRVFVLCRNEDYATICRVATLLWSIWHNRNDKIWNDNHQSMGKASYRMVKVHNVDAAFFVSAGRTAMGACFRNNSGEFMTRITQWKKLTLSTEKGES
ncbi:uncharacterized protein LOC123895511 [Trifolium pratense]|uniref:uncharacterized protein LOC123895511 n=1 Tax=Trifolium pratense TaxID=57577 RepID=UPI001E693339|nr:uncharacterized protein LOC123895511 [Trifolium pratense]